MSFLIDKIKNKDKNNDRTYSVELPVNLTLLVKFKKRWKKKVLLITWKIMLKI